MLDFPELKVPAQAQCRAVVASDRSLHLTDSQVQDYSSPFHITVQSGHFFKKSKTETFKADHHDKALVFELATQWDHSRNLLSIPQVPH